MSRITYRGRSIGSAKRRGEGDQRERLVHGITCCANSARGSRRIMRKRQNGSGLSRRTRQHRRTGKPRLCLQKAVWEYSPVRRKPRCGSARHQKSGDPACRKSAWPFHACKWAKASRKVRVEAMEWFRKAAAHGLGEAGIQSGASYTGRLRHPSRRNRSSVNGFVPRRPKVCRRPEFEMAKHAAFTGAAWRSESGGSLHLDEPGCAPGVFPTPGKCRRNGRRKCLPNKLRKATVASPSWRPVLPKPLWNPSIWKIRWKRNFSRWIKEAHYFPSPPLFAVPQRWLQNRRC